MQSEPCELGNFPTRPNNGGTACGEGTGDRGETWWGQKGKGGGKDNKHRPTFSSASPLNGGTFHMILFL